MELRILLDFFNLNKKVLDGKLMGSAPTSLSDKY